MRRVLVEDEDPTRATVSMGFSNLCMKLSGFCFALAVGLIAFRLAKL
jgi:hypothetical protein